MGIDGIGAAAARRLRYGTQGNPLHARALLEEFPPREWGSDDQLLPSPRSFRRLVQDRYASCAPPTRRLIDAAAVLGPHCPLPLAAVAGRGRRDAARRRRRGDAARSAAGLGGAVAVDAVVPASAGPGGGLRGARAGAAACPAHRGRGADDRRSAPCCGTGWPPRPSRMRRWPPISPSSPTGRRAGSPGKVLRRIWFRPAG